MLRNKQEEKRKTLRRLYERMGEVSWRGVDYVPVEKPYFMGWDVSIILSESGKRRRDAPELQAVLDALGASRKEFTKGVRYIRFLRRRRYSVEDIEVGMRSYKERNKAGTPYWFRPLSSHYVSESAFHNLPMNIRKYFYKRENDWIWWGKYGPTYHLCYPFPTYELVYKVEKAYAAFQGVPRGEEWSEYEHINNILRDNHYWSAKYGYRTSSWDRRDKLKQKLSGRRAWKLLCDNMRKSDFSYEAEEKIMKHLKNQKRHW